MKIKSTITTNNFKKRTRSKRADNENENPYYDKDIRHEWWVWRFLLKNEFSTFANDEKVRFTPPPACTISTPHICGDLRLCKVCGRCVRVCPYGVFSEKNI